ncbi:FAD-linked oxidase C-terminal domain-containing protein [Psychrobacillus lasiicapitis]|uniref:FAD-binding protein n=1 Tax=Psychrobacillus lasiicapitis TaxID=1636719 RepID=A0A544T2N0_9BACI|nr:FAD-linked oxidase C-terminal domain-containing protein [Psychrobacillus lasiicapitis]TQR11713.1 FAD-binding protein [Psychrobacillus lasiicapitis]GGA18892.1 glycolate oxidase subunit GlcD [Psychrobacillus lasiicapitis]
MEEYIIQKLIDITGKENAKVTIAQRLAYSYDATANFQAMPDLVLSPANMGEIQQIVKTCSEYRIPIISRGSGTNLAAGTVPNAGGVILLFNRMNRVLDFDEENLTITVQPGVVTQHINELVEPKGLFYPPDPSSMKISTIGGNVSENSGGLRGLKYGVTRDYVKGLSVVLPNGEILKTGGKLTKDVAGYDLTSLFVGSEGTIGVITEITLGLIPTPQTKQTLLVFYDQLETAAQTVSSIIAAKVVPTTLEFMDKGTIENVEDYMKIGLPTDCEAMLLIELDGDMQTVGKEMQLVLKICKEHGAKSTQLAQSEEEALQLSTARRVALSVLARKRPTTILEDATVPRSEIANMVKEIQRIADKYNLMIFTFGHAGDGNLHPTCLTDARDKEEMERVEAAFSEIFDSALRLGGTITGEHGVGEMKAPYLEWKIGESGIEVMKGIKQSIDPLNIMNPGKIFAKDRKQRVVVHS